MRIGYDRRESSFVLAFSIGIIAIVAAWLFELIGGYLPCKLCLWQRWPYYIALPMLYLGMVFIRSENAFRYRLAFGLGGAAGVVFIASALLGGYHAGVEWGFWAGPSDCGGRMADAPSTVDAFRKSLDSAKVVRCDAASWRLFGLSFAGWNMLVSSIIAAFSLRGAFGKQ